MLPGRLTQKFLATLLLALATCGLTAQARAALIELTTVSPVTAVYDLSISSATEYSGLTGLGVGDTLDLSGLDALFTGHYYIDQVSHSFDSSGGYHSRFTLSRSEGTLVDGSGSSDISLTLVNDAFTIYGTVRDGLQLTALSLVATPAPEPATLWLLAPLLGLLLVWRWRALP